jgi:hypothetical protein
MGEGKTRVRAGSARKPMGEKGDISKAVWKRKLVRYTEIINSNI